MNLKIVLEIFPENEWTNENLWSFDFESSNLNWHKCDFLSETFIFPICATLFWNGFFLFQIFRDQTMWFTFDVGLMMLNIKSSFFSKCISKCYLIAIRVTKYWDLDVIANIAWSINIRGWRIKKAFVKHSKLLMVIRRASACVRFKSTNLWVLEFRFG